MARWQKRLAHIFHGACTTKKGCLAYQFYCSGATLSLYPLAFGDVILAIGQSNMQVDVGFAFNATQEIADSAAFGDVLRFYQVEAALTAKGGPLDDFAVPPSIAWSAPVGAGGQLAGFSATCYFSAKAILLGRPASARSVPLGLIAAPWGGTTIKAHAPPQVNASCAPLYPGGTFGCGIDHAPCNASEIYNAMLKPISGPAGPALPLAALLWVREGGGGARRAPPAPQSLSQLALSPAHTRTHSLPPPHARAQFQGENDASLAPAALAWYTCMLQGLAAALRADHASPGAHWTTIQLAPYTGGAALAPFRDMQCAATAAIPSAHCAVLLDDGDVLSPIGTVHSRNKQLVGRRVAAGVLEALYATPHPTHARGPVFASQALATAPNGSLSALVTFAPGGLGGGALVFAPPHATPWSNSSRCPSELGVIHASDCAWPSIVGSDGKVYSGAAAAAGGGQQLLITAQAPPGVAAAGSALGWGAWPVVNFYNEWGMPVEAWYKTQ